ncbi:MAG: nucleoside kinase [Clostridia bacterium]|nr:nucleoside kinase [Clostridia bacterium]
MAFFSVSDINKNVLENKKDFITNCENAYKNQLLSITDEICRKKGRQLVMLAGPSSSGKTTTASLLKSDCIKNSRHASVISLDDFYRNQDVRYYFEDGTVDYETVKALDTDLIADCLKSLLNDGRADIPHFSFTTKKREGFTTLQVAGNEIIIVEGLHALHPMITDCLEGENMKKLYVSVSSRISQDNKVLLTKRDMRFIRRLIRDYHFRDSQVENTFYLWKGVRMGEDRYLFPYSGRADVRIDSVHPYEVCIFKDIAIKLLDHVGADSIYYPSACELKEKLSQFISLTEGDVPGSSLLKEFIG